MVLFLFVTSPVCAMSNNEIMKHCLDAFGYDKTAPIEQRLNNFNWDNASWCAAGFRAEESAKRREEIRAFLKEKPWFRGKNWKWQERAEYTCTKNYNSGLTYCHKPIYIN